MYLTIIANESTGQHLVAVVVVEPIWPALLKVYLSGRSKPLIDS